MGTVFAVDAPPFADGEGLRRAAHAVLARIGFVGGGGGLERYDPLMGADWQTGYEWDRGPKPAAEAALARIGDLFRKDGANPSAFAVDAVRLHDPPSGSLAEKDAALVASFRTQLRAVYDRTPADRPLIYVWIDWVRFRPSLLHNLIWQRRAYVEAWQRYVPWTTAADSVCGLLVLNDADRTARYWDRGTGRARSTGPPRGPSNTPITRRRTARSRPTPSVWSKRGSARAPDRRASAMRGRLRAVCEDAGLTWRAAAADDAGGHPSLLARLHGPGRYLLPWNGLTALVACVAWLLDVHDVAAVAAAVIDVLCGEASDWPPEPAAGAALMGAVVAWMRGVRGAATPADLQVAVGLVVPAGASAVCRVWDPVRAAFCGRPLGGAGVVTMCGDHAGRLLAAPRDPHRMYSAESTSSFVP